MFSRGTLAGAPARHFMDQSGGTRRLRGSQCDTQPFVARAQVASRVQGSGHGFKMVLNLNGVESGMKREGERDRERERETAREREREKKKKKKNNKNCIATHKRTRSAPVHPPQPESTVELATTKLEMQPCALLLHDSGCAPPNKCAKQPSSRSCYCAWTLPPR